MAQLYLRYGSHAEKEYYLKALSLFDGMMVGANLLEATPAATISLLVKLCGKNSKCSFFIDPMTYAFGEYIDPESKDIRRDLDWIKSDQKIRGQTVRQLKRSYRKLAESLGIGFTCVYNNGASKAIDQFKDISSLCNGVIEYQKNRFNELIGKDDELKQFIDSLPKPKGLLSPYFFIHEGNKESLFDLTYQMAQYCADSNLNDEVYSVLCIDKPLLNDPLFDACIEKLITLKIKGLWLWISQFQEEDAQYQLLEKYLSVVNKVSKSGKQIFNMHGGYFSLLATHKGLTGISHGVGYGEQKDVMPVVGRGIPTVRYYLPPVFKRTGIPEIQRSFSAIEVKSIEDFFSKICDCAICSGILKKGLNAFEEFGEMHYSSEDAKRQVQTPAAAKKCRYHFLLTRAKELKRVGEVKLDTLINEIDNACASWSRSKVMESSLEHIARWKKALSGKSG